MESTLSQFSALAIYGTLVAYTIATVAYAVDLSGLAGPKVENRRRAVGIATSTTVLGLVLHLIGTVTRGFAAGRVPWANMYEFSLVFSLIMVGAYVLLNTRYNLRYLGIAVVGLASVTLWIAVLVFYIEADAVMPALRTFWLVVHVSIATCAVGVVALSAIFSVVQLLQERGELRRAAALEASNTAAGGAETEALAGARAGAGDLAGAKAVAGGEDQGGSVLVDERSADGVVDEDARLGFFGRLSRRLPSSDALELIAFRLNAVGFVLWTLTLITGAVWAEHAWGRPWGWDPKEVWTFLIWVVYAAYLHARLTRGWQGRRAAYLSIFAFALVMGNYYLVNLFFNSQHAYSGIG